MDRRFVYIGEIPQDLDMLAPQRNTMSALGYFTQGVLGTNTLVDGLACTPTSPTSLVVNIGPGSIYSLLPLDANAFGTMAPDITHQIVKQGILWDAVQLTLTPPATAGQAINYLVQAELLEQDITPVVEPYFNPASLTNVNAAPFSGPNNSGTAQPTTRQATITISLKPGPAATAGSQVTPAADPGYVGLYSITVAQGQTQISAANISVIDNAPFINVKLPQVPGWVQGGSYCYAEDTSAAANAITVTLSPLPASIGKGFGIRCRVANANTGATTITILRNTLSSLGPYAVVRSNGSPLLSGDIAAGQVIDLVFDGTSFRDITGTNTSSAVGNLTAQSGEGVNVDASAHVSLNYPGLTTASIASPDLLSFYSQSATHHRSITFANLLTALGSSSGQFQGIQVITATGVWTPPSGVNNVLVFATGPGGAGGGANGNAVGNGEAAGGGAGATAIAYVPLANVASVSVTVGTGGTGVAGQSGNAGSGNTAFGTYAVAGPGGGGQGADTSEPEKWGGAGGTATAGILQLRGAGGDGATGDLTGNGGNSFWCGGGRGASPAGYVGPGEAGVYGSGGGGADDAQLGSSQPGGKGGDGVIVLFMFS